MIEITPYIVEGLSWILILTGSFLTVTGAFGMVRFPNFWSRIHASSVIDSGGVILLLLGMCLQAGWTLVTAKLIFILIFMFITGPTAAHAIAHAARVNGDEPPQLKKGRKK